MIFFYSLGQSYTMQGSGLAGHTLGIMPSAVWWLYKALEDHKAQTGSRYSVRVSAVQVAPGDVLTDLLAPYSQGMFIDTLNTSCLFVVKLPILMLRVL